MKMFKRGVAERDKLFSRKNINTIRGLGEIYRKVHTIRPFEWFYTSNFWGPYIVFYSV